MRGIVASSNIKNIFAQIRQITFATPSLRALSHWAFLQLFAANLFPPTDERLKNPPLKSEALSCALTTLGLRECDTSFYLWKMQRSLFQDICRALARRPLVEIYQSPCHLISPKSLHPTGC